LAYFWDFNDMIKFLWLWCFVKDFIFKWCGIYVFHKKVGFFLRIFVDFVFVILIISIILVNTYIPCWIVWFLLNIIVYLHIEYIYFLYHLNCEFHYFFQCCKFLAFFFSPFEVNFFGHHILAVFCGCFIAAN